MDSAWVHGITGIDRTNYGEVILYPQPATDQLFLSWKPDNPDASIHEIIILDVTGRQLAVRTYTDDTGTDQLYDLSSLVRELSAGMYLVTLKLDEGWESFRFVLE